MFGRIYPYRMVFDGGDKGFICLDLIENLRNIFSETANVFVFGNSWEGKMNIVLMRT